MMSAQILDAKSPYFCRISVEARCFWTPVPCYWQGGRLDFLSTIEKIAFEELEATPVVSMVVLFYVLSWSDDWMIWRDQMTKRFQQNFLDVFLRQVNSFSNRRFLMNLFERRITSESNTRNLRILWKTCFQFEQWDWLLVNPAFFHDLFLMILGRHEILKSRWYRWVWMTALVAICFVSKWLAANSMFSPCVAS